MKLSCAQFLLVILFSGLTYATEIRAQEVLARPVTFQCQNQQLDRVLAQLETLTQVKFIFSSRLIQSDRLVTLNARQETLSNVLKLLLQPMRLTYEISGNKIILNRSADAGPNVPSPAGMEKQTGKVTDERGEAMPGVSVVVKGTQRGTATSPEGTFSIDANIGETLIFSYIGYVSREVAIENNNPLTVSLKQSEANLSEVVVVGSRFAQPRTDVDRPVAIDVISAKELQSSGQVDLGQTITFAAPSFNAVKFGINDAAPFVDPATLRGLGPDQVLVLVNNKRRHKVSFVSINDGVGKGQVGTDINVVPSLSLKRVEVLRDGAAAQYGSDAIAGVINLELNDAAKGGAINVFTGIGYSKPNLDVTGQIPPTLITDGATYNLNANFGLKLAQKGFVNTTVTYAHTDGYDRSGTYKSSAGYYVKDPVQDAQLVKQNNIDLNRAVLGSARNTTYGIFINAGLPVGKNWQLYGFGGYTHKHVVTGVFTRAPTNTRRSDLTIFPNGYNPEAPANLQDVSLTAGLKGKLGEWNADFSVSQGMNQVDWYVRNTVNPSLGAQSPTSFYVGQTRNTQSLFNADVARTYRQGSYPNFNLGAGTEIRYETYRLRSGDPASYEAGPLRLTKDIGSLGREGFSNWAAGQWGRTNVGVYVEGESDLTAKLLVGAAARFENYSDFGSNMSYKINSRYKIAEPFAVRASFSRGFRAPSVTQAYYSNYVNISFDNAGNSIINPIIPAESALAELLGIDGLKQEISRDYSAGITSKIGQYFTLTADLYQIDVDNRIMLSGNIDVSKIPQFVAAGFPQTANVFVNAIDTRTRGFELVTTYNRPLTTKSKIGINLAYSSMNTSLRANRKTATGIEVADQVATLYITDGLPRDKFIGTVNYDYGKFGLMVRGSRFGQVSDPLATLAVKPTDVSAPTYQVFSARTLFDASVTFRPVRKLSVIGMVNNVFDVYPDLLQVPQTNSEVVFSRRTNQFGMQGRFLNLTVNYAF
ncbi:TonB-dependent receptor [Spirosoma rhododendri]|uniref:TonB-dependent receptor n=1 Tax=Spirosoma rhododendri TaxID=2728024 RepID=A0A7L5DQN6_9BACT|nr:TonB-dependent receptor [Spirosoma rhododendri]QJD80716.1 TonB-dependent receptor [Spirosoma rhododendri]